MSSHLFFKSNERNHWSNRKLCCFSFFSIRDSDDVVTVCLSVTRCIDDAIDLLLMLSSASFEIDRLDKSCDIGATFPSEAVLFSKVFVSYLIG